MSKKKICPVWKGYMWLNPLRKLRENPQKILGPYVKPGMTVLEPGCAMGFFTMPLAKMVGSNGHIVCLDVQQKMLDQVRRRAWIRGLKNRVETRLIKGNGLEVDDLSGAFDFTVAIHMVHEVPSKNVFFKDAYKAGKQGSGLLFMEPEHITPEAFGQSLEKAKNVGFEVDSKTLDIENKYAFLVKP